MIRSAVLLLVAAILAGCAGVNGGASMPWYGPSRAEQQLVFLDRLATAPRDELDRMGADLRADARDDGDTGAALRYALWLATPGHDGHDARAARRRLEAVLVDGPRIDRPLRALVRVQLRALRSRLALLEANARLSAETERLREQIQALTQLERRMGSEPGDP